VIYISCPGLVARKILAWEMFAGMFTVLILGSVSINLGDISLVNKEEE